MFSFARSTALTFGLVAIASSTAADYTAVQSYSGFAKNVLGTDYLPNKCRYTDIWRKFVSAGESHFAYVLKPQWNNGTACGQCAKVKYSGTPPDYLKTREVTVLITSYDDNELCPTGDPRCQSGSLMISRQAFRDLFDGSTASSAPIEWEVVPCPEEFVKGNVELYFFEGLSKPYVNVQPRNFARPVQKIEVQFADGTSSTFLTPNSAPNQAGGSFFTLFTKNPDLFNQPFTLQLFSEDGQMIETKFDTFPSPRDTVYTNGQFN